MSDDKCVCSGSFSHKKVIDYLSKTDFPINEGSGESIDDAIVIVNNEDHTLKYGDVEFDFMRYRSLVLGCSWTIEKESFYQKDTHLYHKVEVFFKGQEPVEDGSMHDYRFTYYFDISACVEKLAIIEELKNKPCYCCK